MSKEAMKLALEALNNATSYGSLTGADWVFKQVDEAIKALEEALAKQEQRNDSEHLGEPVALTWNKKMDAVQAMLGITSGELDCLGESLLETYANDVERVYKALYTTPQQRKPLTDEQIVPMFRAREKLKVLGEKDAWFWYAWGIGDAEAAHSIKE